MFHPVFNEWLHYRGPRHRGVDFLLLCALKNQPPTHVDRARIRRTHNARRVRAFVCDVTRTQIRGKIGDDCNFSQRRQSLREPLIIGPSGYMYIPRLGKGGEREGGRSAEFWLFFGGLMFVKMDILLSFVPSTGTPFFRSPAKASPAFVKR